LDSVESATETLDGDSTREWDGLVMALELSFSLLGCCWLDRRRRELTRKLFGWLSGSDSSITTSDFIFISSYVCKNGGHE